jgi:proteasome-associated ATPase
MVRGNRAESSNQAQQSDRTAPNTVEGFLQWIEMLNMAGADLRPVAERLAKENFALRAAIEEVRGQQAKLRSELDALCAPEHYPATITRVSRNGQVTAEVFGAGMYLEVPVHPDVPAERLRVGARGLLSKGRNCLVKVDGVSPVWTEVGAFEGFACNRSRILLRHQEQLVAATPTEELAETELRKGDLVGFDRDGARLAYAKVDPPGNDDLFFEATPRDRFEELGGLDNVIAKLKRALDFRFLHPDIAAKYKLASKRGILLDGPPGNGKTKLARCAANHVASRAAAGECRFMAISGSSDYSMWLGQSEQRIIARFRAARELAERGIAVLMFFDELDAIGRRRGSDYGSGAPDRILGTLLAQLDGIQQVSNVVIVAATNRADILDKALTRPGRLGDVRLHIPAPNRRAARAILLNHLNRGRPLAIPELNGTLEGLVECLLSRIYSPRGEYAELARVQLRDGRRIPVAGRDLVSGASLENVVSVAAEEAADREVQTGVSGILESDLTTALDNELRTTAAILTPQNVRDYFARLPQDVDPVAVEVMSRGATTAYARTA